MSLCRDRRAPLLLAAGVLWAAGCGPAEGSRIEALWREAGLRLGLAPPAEIEPPPPPATPAAEAPAPARPPEPEPAPAREDEAPGYWRYSEPGGAVRFVGSLAEVPEAARGSARRIATAAPARGAPARRASAPRPARARPAEPPPRPVARAVESGSVVVYTTSWCGWCRKTLAWLDARGVAYENRDIEDDPAWAAELRRKTGSQSIPVVDVDGRIVRGFDPQALEELL